MPEKAPKVVRISVENGEVLITPRVVDLAPGEEVEWVSTEPGWEVTFEQVAARRRPPFREESFGPGINPSNRGVEDVSVAETRASSGESGNIDGGDFDYTARVRGASPRSGRVRIFRGVRE